MNAAVPRVVVLTTGGDYGLLVLHELARRRVAVAGTLVQADVELDACFRRSDLPGRVATLPVAIARSVHRRRLARARAARFRHVAGDVAGDVVVTGRRNGARMRRDVERLAPDLLVLGGVGLLDAAILALPRWGTLNGHPGLLPWLRGNGVVAHAMLRDVAVGASCHWVDAGIDQGPVVERRLLPVGPSATLASLESDAVRLAATLLADVVAAAVTAGAPPTAIAQTARHPLCRWATPAERRAAEAAVGEGKALDLFERWSARCRPPSSPWRLAPAAPD